MSRFRTELIEELRREGATPAEATAMAEVAVGLADLSGSPLEAGTRRRWLPRLGFGLAGAAVGMAVMVWLVAVSLQALPGQWDHPLKSASQTVAVKLDPALATAVMMDKSWEVAQLSARHQSPQLVLATLRQYNTDFARLPAGDHYAAWGYCSRELREAAADNQGNIKQAIEQSYASIPQG